MSGITRRGFMKGCLGTGVALTPLKFLSGCQPAVNIPELPVKPTDQSARVAAILGTDLARMTRQALEVFGGIGTIINPGETIFLKPNFCAAGLVKHDPIPTGDSTKPEIVIAMAEECLKAGAAKVIIGDAAQVPSYSWEGLKTLDQTTNMLAEGKRLNDTYSGKVELSCLNTDSPEWVAVPSPGTNLGEIFISSQVARADKVISLAVLKTHRWTQMTGAMKNFVGVTPVSKYGAFQWRYKLHNAVGGIEQCFLDIVSAVKPVFSLIDVSICCEGNGPHVLPGYWGSTIDVKERLGSWLILASPDPVAVDATASRVIGLDPGQVGHLQKAYVQGLGQMNENAITLVGSALKDIQVEFEFAQPTDGFWDILWPGIMMLTQG
jgi:uncharacterized protein (DUF362 family)